MDEVLDDATFELVRDLTLRADLWDRRAIRHLAHGRDQKCLQALEKRDHANARRERWLYGETAGIRFAQRARAERARLALTMGVAV